MLVLNALYLKYLTIQNMSQKLSNLATDGQNNSDPHVYFWENCEVPDAASIVFHYNTPHGRKRVIVAAKANFYSTCPTSFGLG